MPPLAIDPVTEAEIYLQSVLSAHSGVTAVFGNRIYAHPAPRTDQSGNLVEYPILTYTYLNSDDDLMLVGATTFWSTLRFLVRGITDTNNQLALRDGVAAIYEALHATSGYTNNATISACYRSKPFSMPEVTNSIHYIHRGGEYILHLNGHYQ